MMAEMVMAMAVMMAMVTKMVMLLMVVNVEGERQALTSRAF